MQAPVENNPVKPVWLLLIEDSPADARLIQALLEEQGDYHIDHVVRLRQALQWLQDSTPDMILLDLQLPDSTGLDALHTLHSEFHDIPIVIMTGQDDVNDLNLSCIEQGAEDFLLKKDLQPLILRRVIGHALSRFRERQLSELRRTLEHYQMLTSGAAKSLATRQLAGLGSIRETAKEKFLELTNIYCRLLNSYLECMVLKKEKPNQTMASLATQMGDLGAGPRDLIDLHKQALERLTQGVNANRAYSYMVEGRLLALEMMGLLVDYYRIGTRHIDTTSED